MATANIQIKKVLVGRGNTAVSSVYSGVRGEITMDTDLKTLRVHDGTTVGGTRLATFGELEDIALGNINLSGYATTAQITAANANAAVQALAITSLQANAALQASLIDTLTGNAATQGSALSNLVSNAAAQSIELSSLLGNAVTQAGELTTLLGNAATQSGAITNLQANAATQAVAIDNINATVANVASTLTNGAYQFKLQANGNVTTNNDSFFLTPANTTIGIKTTGATGQVKIGWVDNVTGDQATVNHTTDGIEFHTTDAGVQRYWRFRVNGATEFPLFNFPVGGGAPGQRLTTNGVGQLYWDTPANLKAESGNIVANQDAVYSLGEPNFRWKVLYSANVVVGAAGHQFLPNSVAEFSGNVNSYSQINFRNQRSGTAATTDYILTADNGTDTEYYLDVGLTNSGYDNTNPVNSLGNVITANDGYIYIQGNTANATGGNLALGVTTPGKHVTIFAGGVNDNNEVAKFDSTGVTVTGNLELTNGTTYSNSIVTLPTTTNGTTNSFLWKFSDLLVGNETVTLNWNLLGANANTFLIGTGLASTPGYFNFNGIDKTLGFISNSGTEGDGKLTFGANTNGGAGNVNDIELTTVTGNAYIRAGGDSWKFDNDGKLTAPGEVYGQYFTLRGGNGPGAEIGSLGYGGNVVTVHSYEGFRVETGAIESGPQWQFGTDGNLTLPGSIVSNDNILIDNREAGVVADISIYSADNILLQGADRTNAGEPEGGDINIYAGNGSPDNNTSGGGGGGDIQLSGGVGGTGNIISGGFGGTISISGGNGGDGSAVAEAGSGGSISITAGSGGQPNGGGGGFGGGIYITAGDTTDAALDRGSIILSSGEGGDETTIGGYVQISIPAVGTNPGGDWTFTGSGLTLEPPPNAEIFNPSLGNLTIGTVGNTIVRNIGGVTTYDWVFGDTGNLIAPGNIQAQNIRTVESTVHIGKDAGLTSQSANAVAVGTHAGRYDQDENTVAIGLLAGNNSQGGSSVAVGALAGANVQGVNSVAVGTSAAEQNQGNASTALGFVAGEYNQGNFAVAIGSGAAYTGQGDGAIAIGADASPINQGDYSIAIGAGASVNSLQPNNSIIIDATGTQLAATGAGLFVAPVREATSGNVLYYDAATKEITYSAGAYGNVEVDAYLQQLSTIAFTASPATISGVQNFVTSTANVTANLTVGGNITVTGNVNITGGEWREYTPVWTSADGNAAIGNGFVEGRYKQIGKVVHVYVAINFGSSTTFGSGEYKVSLPVPGRSVGMAILNLVMHDVGTRLYNSLAHNIYSTYNQSYDAVTLFWDTGVVTHNSPFTWTDGDYFVISGTYEAAS